MCRVNLIAMQDFFYVKDGSKNVQVLFSDILYIEAKDKYATLVTANERYLILQPLHIIERVLPAKTFCRIHRSYIISLAHTKWFDHTIAFVGNQKLAIGKNYKNVIPGRVVILSNEQDPYINLSDFDRLNLIRKIKPN